MATGTVTSWTIPVSTEIDESVRGYLVEHGMTGKDLPKFIEEAVRRHMFDRTLDQVRARFAHLRQDEIEELVDEAVSSVRAEARHAKGR